MKSRRQRFGQHFLNSRSIARRIVEFAHVDNKIVIEIGAGKGILTELIAAKAQEVYAVEIDVRLSSFIRSQAFPRVKVINRDIRSLPLDNFHNAVFVGNIPYSISTDIIEYLAQYRAHMQYAVLTVQKEFGTRMQASPGTRAYGPLAVFVNSYFSVGRGFIIGSRFFTPQPKVSSVVLKLEKRDRALIADSESDFFSFVRKLFRYRRKAVRNALLHCGYLVEGSIDTVLMAMRPAQLSIKQLKDLWDHKSCT
jgi:16S rRNA (adenine1518-N6/adenine1519-N6)-dimethyltransferase